MSATTKSSALWAAIGIAIVGLTGLLGFRAAHPDSVLAGLASAAIAAVIIVGAWLLWTRQESRHPAPAAEYLAAAWVLSYLGLLAVTATQRRLNIADWFFLLPPVSFLPIAVRLSLSDDGDPMGRARTAAQLLHRILGWALTALGLVFAVSLFFLSAAPLPLIPGLMHLRAAYLYRAARGAADEPDPRLGFMQKSR